MRRRLDLAAALVAKPDVLFLDEPTTGLDPRSRSQMWESIQELVRGGSTVLLTTQYMEEADRLADDIVVIDRGQMIAHGTADELKTQTGGERIELVLADAGDTSTAQTILTSLSVGDVQSDAQTRRLTAAVTGGADALRQVLQRLAEAEVKVVDVGLRRPTLDDVFLTLTGHAAEEVAEENDDSEQSGHAGSGSQDTREKEVVG
jgi:ABC-2 type transport system ATP-binding protein